MDTNAVILLKSLTEANKAKKQLTAYNIKSSVEKITAKRGGCSYGIKIHGSTDPEKVCRLLGTVNIKCLDIMRRY